MEGNVTAYKPGFFKDGQVVLIGERAYVDAANHLFHLNGNAAPLYAANKFAGLILNRETVREYLRYFCTYLHGPCGPFMLVEPPDLLDETEEAFSLKGVVNYAGMMFKAEFAVFKSGMVEMTDDDPMTKQ